VKKWWDFGCGKNLEKYPDGKQRVAARGLAARCQCNGRDVVG